MARIVPFEKKVGKNRTVLGRSASEGEIIGDVTGPLIPEADWLMFSDQGETF